ncbi:MAG: hypothetical protein GY737_16190 [Desulfobacteraceae bacterium]|nr:hypothetical protein [Desulfobacteraceae bacterium]
MESEHARSRFGDGDGWIIRLHKMRLKMDKLGQGAAHQLDHTMHGDSWDINYRMSMCYSALFENLRRPPEQLVQYEPLNEDGEKENLGMGT